VACGIGMFWEAITVTILVLTVLSILRFATRFLPSNETKRQRLEIEILSTAADRFISTLYALCERHQVKIRDVKVHIKEKEDANKVRITCETNKGKAMVSVIEALQTYKGVLTVSVTL
jgi:uncharacterized membrane protein YhiD involved in acid resistance